MYPSIISLLPLDFECTESELTGRRFGHFLHGTSRHANEKGGEAKEQSKPTATKKIKKFKVTKKVKNAQGEEITEVRY